MLGLRRRLHDAARLVTRVAGLLLVASLISACGFLGGGLRTNPTRLGSCGIGVGRDAILHGSAADAKLAWAVDRSTGARVELIWPVGYTAQFTPDLVVVDRTGNPVAHEGDLIIGSCLKKPEDGDAIEVDPADIRGPDWEPGDG